MRNLYKQGLLLIVSFILSLLLISCGGGGSGIGGEKNSNMPYSPVTPTSKEIISYSINGYSGIIDSKKITVYVPYGTKLESLVAEFQTTGTQVLAKNNDTSQIEPQISGVTANNFTESVNYIVKAADGSVANYVVDIVVDTSFSNKMVEFSINGRLGVINGQNISVVMPHNTNLTSLAATFIISGAYVKVNDRVQKSDITENDFTNPLIYKVFSVNKIAKHYTVNVTTASESDSSITFFKLDDYIGTINQSDRSITVTVPQETDLNRLVARFATSGTVVKIGDTTQQSGVTQNDFTKPVVYTVYAYNGTIAQYTVTVKVASIISMYVFYPGIYYTNFQNPESYGNVNIDESLSLAYHISFDNRTREYLGLAINPTNVGSIYNNTYGAAYAMEADPNNESLVWVFSANISNNNTDNRIQAFQIQDNDDIVGLNNTTSKIRGNILGMAPWLNKAIVAKKDDPDDSEYIYQLYTSYDGNSSIDKYTINHDNNQAFFSNSLDSNKDQKFDMVITPNGQYGYVTNYNDNHITEYKILNDGTWYRIGNIDFGGGSAAQVLVDRYGEYLYVLNGSSNNIVVFKIDNRTGYLTEMKNISVPNVQSLSSMVLNPRGDFLYVSSFLEATAYIYSYKIDNGVVENNPTSQSSITIDDAPDKLFIDPTGYNLVYVDPLCHNTMYMTKIDKTTGVLSDPVKQIITDKCMKSEPTIIAKLK